MIRAKLINNCIILLDVVIILEILKQKRKINKKSYKIILWNSIIIFVWEYDG